MTLCTGLILCLMSSRSNLNIAFHACSEGCLPSNIRPLRHFQIAHKAQVATSINLGPWNVCQAIRQHRRAVFHHHRLPPLLPGCSALAWSSPCSSTCSRIPWFEWHQGWRKQPCPRRQTQLCPGSPPPPCLDGATVYKSHRAATRFSVSGESGKGWEGEGVSSLVWSVGVRDGYSCP
jgi:hypothetical protein